jgi:hypothetical protein
MWGREEYVKCSISSLANISFARALFNGVSRDESSGRDMSIEVILVVKKRKEI